MSSPIKLFLTFFKLGLFTFGGGYAMIPQLKDIVIEKEKWLTEEEMMEIIAIAESTPGPLAINMATYIGYQQRKLLGSFMATLGVVLPSLIIIFIISLFFKAFIKNIYVQYAFEGIKCCVAFLILKAGIEMFFKKKKDLFSIIMFSIVFILLITLELLGFDISSIILIIIGGLLGILCYAIFNKKKVVEQE